MLKAQNVYATFITSHNANGARISALSLLIFGSPDSASDLTGKKPPEVVLLFFLGSFCQRAQGAMFGKAVPKQDAMGRKIQHLTLTVCQPRSKTCLN